MAGCSSAAMRTMVSPTVDPCLFGLTTSGSPRRATPSSGADYATLSGTVSFAAGELWKDVVVTPVNDQLLEPDETVIVTLQAAANGEYTRGSDVTATVTIADGDIGVWVSAGGRHELPHEHGIAHLLEHMAFKGTVRRNSRQIAEEIKAVGGHINAATSAVTTAY